MRSRFTKITVAALAILVVLTLSLSLLRSQPSPEPISIGGSVQLYSSRIIGRNILFPSLVNGNSLRFFTGSAFAEFNLDNFTSRSLTKEFALPTVDQVRWNGNKALIKVEKVSPYDDLYKIASQEAQNEPSWWVVNLDSSDIRQLKANIHGYTVVDAAWSKDDNLYVLSQKKAASDEIIEKQNLSSSIMASSKTSSLSFIGETKKGLAVQKSGKSLLVWNNRKFSTLVSSLSKSTMSADTGYLFYANPSGNIYEYDTSTPSHLTQFIEAKDNTNNYSAFQNGLLMLPAVSGSTSQANLSGSLLLNQVSEIKRYLVNISAGDSTMVGSIKNVFELPTSGAKQFSFVVSNNDNDLFLLSTDPANSQKSTPYPIAFLPGNSLVLSNATSAYDVLYNHLYIYIQSNSDTQSQRNQVLQQLRSYGDPNQVYKTWQ